MKKTMVMVLGLLAGGAQGTVYYVDGNVGSSGDGLGWGTAKKTIGEAVALAMTAGDKVVVTNGVYAETVSTANRLITISSVEGADVTVIDGGGTNRCATLAASASATTTNTVLSGFTLRNGRLLTANSDGGGACGGTLNGCVLSNNVATRYGGGTYYSVLNNCVVSSNTATSYGGGVCYGTLNNCRVSSNTAANSGGGAYQGTLNNCVVSGNSAPNGGGMRDSTLNNCTVWGNTATSYGGGTYSGTLNNCIVWGNIAPSGTNYHSGTVRHTCTTPFVNNTGNIAKHPLLRSPEAGDFRLMPSSPCFDAGSNTYTNSMTDIAGNPRVLNGTVDMGAHEGAQVFRSAPSDMARNLTASIDRQDGVMVAWDAPSGGGAVLYRVLRLDTLTGLTEPVSGWIAGTSFLDTPDGGFDCVYSVVVAFDAQLDDLSVPSAAAVGWRGASLYVDASQADDNGDGRSWANAKKTIQAAVELATNREAVAVADGVYTPLTTTNKTIIVRSVNGADAAVINGGGTGRCATLGSTTGQTNVMLVGFTLTNGRTNDGAAVYYGALKNCVLSNNVASRYGGGSYYSLLNNCALSGNVATNNGGGTYYGTLNNCVLSGNTASSYGGGAYYGTLNNCVLSGNSVTDSGGGGAWECTLNNCVLSGNTAYDGGGGTAYSTLNNCTVWGNTAYEGGGAYADELNNCIVWGNVDGYGFTDNYASGGIWNPVTFSYSCTTPLPSGNYDGPGNIEQDPRFRFPEIGDFRLLPGSPCLDTGSNAYTNSTTDILGNPRVQNGTADMGACEGAGTLRDTPSDLPQNLSATQGRSDGILISWDAPAAGNAVLYRVFRQDAQTGQWTPVSGWVAQTSASDVQVAADTDYTYAVVAAFDTALDAVSALSQPVTGRRIGIRGIYYVDASRPDDDGDGRSWATAKKTLQAAIDLTVPGDTVAVTNGVYRSITTGNKAIMIYSVDGAEATAIDGGGARRCATLGQRDENSGWAGQTNTVLIGFTLRNGWTSGGGGGACGGTLENCVLTDNRATGSDGGGGACGGTLRNCTLTRNTGSGGASSCTLYNCTLTWNTSTYGGGGADHCTLYDCTLAWNTAARIGGGVWGGTLYNCTLSGNTAMEDGGGAWISELHNCVLAHNTAAWNGGGSYRCSMNNCTLLGNRAASGGGAWNNSTYHVLNNCVLTGNTASQNVGGVVEGVLNNCVLTGNTTLGTASGARGATLNNCTVVGNGKGTSSSGVYLCTVRNSIVWGNGNSSTYSDVNGGTLSYSCTSVSGGTGNISQDPLFVNAAGGDFRLLPGSPCIDAGNNAYTNSMTDVLGNPRLQGLAVDMGAYESTPRLTFTPEAQTVPYTGGVFRVTVTCEEGWTVSCESTWVALGMAGGNSSATFTCTVPSYTGTVERTASIVFSCGSYQATLPVLQVPKRKWIEIGTGTAITQETPFNFFYNTSVVQTIYTESEMRGASGRITEISYFYNSTSSSDLNNRTVQVWIAPTTLTDLSGGWIATNQFTKVFEGAVSVPRGRPYTLTLPLDTPYLYTNGNLCVMTVRPMDPQGYLSSVYALATAVTTQRTRHYYNDSTAFNFNSPQTGSLLSYIANIRLNVAELDDGGHTTTTPVPVPHGWLNAYTNSFAFNGDYEALAWLDGLNGYKLWESYEANLTPTLATNKLRIIHFAVDGTTVTDLRWAPDHRFAPDPADRREYDIIGKTNLLLDAGWHTPTNSATRFFRVRAKLPAP